MVVSMTITNTFPEYLRKCFAGESLAPELSRLRFSKALTVHEVLVGVRDGAIGRKEGNIVLGRSCCVISMKEVVKEKVKRRKTILSMEERKPKKCIFQSRFQLRSCSLSTGVESNG
jgi:hypothetical protein